MIAKNYSIFKNTILRSIYLKAICSRYLGGLTFWKIFLFFFFKSSDFLPAAHRVELQRLNISNVFILTEHWDMYKSKIILIYSVEKMCKLKWTTDTFC